MHGQPGAFAMGRRPDRDLKRSRHAPIAYHSFVSRPARRRRRQERQWRTILIVCAAIAALLAMFDWHAPLDRQPSAKHPSTSVQGR
jgi:hypothetical protein